MPAKKKGESLVVLSADWAISSDARQWKLCKKVTDRSSPDGFRWSPEKYYPTLKSAVEYFIEMSLRESEYSSVKELAENLEAIKASITDKLLDEVGIQ